MIGDTNAGTLRRAAWVAATLALCLPIAWARGQQHSAPRQERAPQPHYSASRSQPSRPESARPQPGRQQLGKPQNYGQPNQQYRQYGGVAPQNRGGQPAPMNSPMTTRPGYPGSNPGFANRYPGSNFVGSGSVRPNFPRYMEPGYAPPGHLGAWLNQHRGVPVQDQERMLRSDPSFSRLSPADQQRLATKLHQVDQMPQGQRERTLARAEALERLSPQERAQVTDSARQWRTLPQDRQTIMRDAFRNLREVPPDQRQMVLNSSRYQNAFSPEERCILSNMLRVEPYQPPRQ